MYIPSPEQNTQLWRCQGIKPKDGRSCKKVLGQFWPGSRAVIAIGTDNHPNHIEIPAATE